MKYIKSKTLFVSFVIFVRKVENVEIEFQDDLPWYTLISATRTIKLTTSNFILTKIIKSMALIFGAVGVNFKLMKQDCCYEVYFL